MAKQRFYEAEKRLFRNVFICMNCGVKIRADVQRIKTGKVKCRKCKRKDFRPIHRPK